MQSISGIITQIRSSKGEVPPPLVGPSVTMANDQLFVFGGRLVSTRKMTNQLFVMDVNTQVWSRHIPSPDSDKPPTPRYFHSASVYKRSLIIFGGMGYTRKATSKTSTSSTTTSTATSLGSTEDDGGVQNNSSGLCVVEDISVLDLDTMTWRRPPIQPSLFSPRPRYAHLAEIVNDKLVVIGGQDMNNNYLPEMNLLDLKLWEWVQVKTFDKHVGAYRSIAVTTPPGTRLPTAVKDTINEEAQQQRHMTADNETNTNKSRHQGHQQSSTPPANEEQNPIYLYTNYNFTDVKRELQLAFMPSTRANTPTIEDCSSFMTGSAMPPGLRFPTGHALGHHMILAGTYLSPQAQSYSIWSLNLGTLTWSRIETGAIFSTGSWNRGVLHESSNRFLVFGNQHRSLLEDYNHRQMNFDQMAVVDLEAFGVYQLPRVTCSTLAQEMGLSLLNEPAVSDFFMVTRENQSIPVNSAVLAQRWPYFADLMEANKTQQQQQFISTHSTTPGLEDDPSLDDPLDSAMTNSAMANSSIMKSHSMLFPYSYPVVIALLQFIYTDNLLTAQQYQPHILAQLLLLSDMYELPRLKSLTTHALHQMLNMSTAPLIFETAALSHQTSLQIRALKMMIAAKKMIQQQQMIQSGVNMEASNSSSNRSSPMLTSASAPTMQSPSASDNHLNGVGSRSPLNSPDDTFSFSSRQCPSHKKPLSSRRSPPVQQQHLPDMSLTSKYDRYSSATQDIQSPTGRSSTPLGMASPGSTSPPPPPQMSSTPSSSSSSSGHRYSITASAATLNNTSGLMSPPMTAKSSSFANAIGTGTDHRAATSPPTTPRHYPATSHPNDSASSKPSKPKKKKGSGMSFFGGKLFQ